MLCALHLEPPQLPDGLSFYEVGGQMVFPLYGVTGSLTTSVVSYLIKKGTGVAPKGLCDGSSLPIDEGVTDFGNGWKLAVLRWTGEMTVEGLKEKVSHFVKELTNA